MITDLVVGVAHVNEIKVVVTGVYLIALAIRDIRRRSVPRWSLAVGLAGAMVYALMALWQGHMGIVDILLGMLPGLLLLALAWLTRKIGYADGMVLLLLGVLYGYGQAVFVLCISMLLVSALSMILLALRKVRRNTQIPYLPFLAVVFLIQRIVMRL